MNNLLVGSTHIGSVVPKYAVFKRIADIEEVIKRVDLRWEEGFINKDEYLEKRRQLQRELDALRPVDYDELAEAEDMLTHFDTYWDSCEEQVNPGEARKQLLDKIVERVFVHDRQVLLLILHGNFGVVLGENETASTEIVNAVHSVFVRKGITLNLGTCQHGSDGRGLLIGCFVWMPKDRLYRFLLRQSVLHDRAA